MPESISLKLPLLVAEQAQKHVTHNEALRALDALVQLSVKDRDLATPPGSPAEGDRYIVAASPTGVWSGHAADIAVWQDGAWDFHDPHEGWRCWVDDENVFLIFNGSAWVDWGAALGALQNLTRLGIGTTADATNPFSAKLNKALWTAKYAAESGDGDLRYTMNKEATSDTVSILLQKAFSGRAEIGLIGDDDLLFKVSPDGAAWVDALRIDKTSGKLTFLGQLQFPATQNPSSDANCLDDYEEGTFTPSYGTDGTAFTTVTHDLQTGSYTKAGRMVHVAVVLRTDVVTVGAATGAVVINGLPFTSAVFAAIGLGDVTSFTIHPIGAQVVQSTTRIRLTKRTAIDGATSSLAPADLLNAANSNLLGVAGIYSV